MSASVASRSAGPSQSQRPRSIKWDIPGFGPDTKITTSFGDVPAQLLHERDMVRTANGGFKRIQWIKRIGLDEDFMLSYPEAHPIMIRANAFGSGRPKSDILVSPMQQMVMKGVRADAKPRTAASLEGSSQIMRKPVSTITYTMFHCGEKTTVCADGAWAEVKP